MADRAARSSRRIAAAVTVAILAHAAVICVFAWITITSQHDRDVAPAPAVASDEATAPAPPPTVVSLLALDADAHAPRARIDPVDPVVPRPGLGDAIGADEAVNPRASIDRPSAQRDPIDRGGGAPGGPDAWSGRRDRADDALLAAEPWNGGRTYTTAHDDTRAPARTTEAIHRAPTPDIGDRQRAIAGAPGTTPSRGDASGPGEGRAAPSAITADPLFDRPAGRNADAPVPGASRDETHASFTDVGARAEDVTRHGAVGDDRAVAAQSDRRKTDPYDITPPTAGGADRGVRGQTGTGAAADGGRAPGDAASRADVAPGDAGLTVTARPEDPYFRQFLRRLEDAVAYPKDLALELRSGRVIASFAVAADGTVRDVHVEVPSTYAAFDDALVAGLRHVGTLGPVPRRLLGGAALLRVRVPFTFSNPMIR